MLEAEKIKKSLKPFMEELYKSGKYTTSRDFLIHYQSFFAFHTENNLDYKIAHNVYFASKETLNALNNHDNWLKFVDEMYKEFEKDKKIEEAQKNQKDVEQTKIGNEYFYAKENKIIAGETEFDPTKQDENGLLEGKDAFDNQANHIKEEVVFKKINEIDPRELSKEELDLFGTIYQDPEKEKYELRFKDGKLDGVVKDTSLISDNLAHVEKIDGENTLVQDQSENVNENTIGEKNKVLVKQKKTITSNAAFVNTLILAFVVGSFFGILFLIIYNGIMK